MKSPSIWKLAGMGLLAVIGLVVAYKVVAWLFKILLVVVVLAAVGAAIYYLWLKPKEDDPPDGTSTGSSSKETTPSKPRVK